MHQLEENRSDGLSIFEPPPLNTAIQSKIWIQFPLCNQITECGVIEFVIPPQTAGYMDLKNSSLKVKLKVTDSFGKPITDDANVGLVCLPLQSIFSQNDCTLQQTPIRVNAKNRDSTGRYFTFLKKDHVNFSIRWEKIRKHTIDDSEMCLLATDRITYIHRIQFNQIIRTSVVYFVYISFTTVV
jgi:hypothetical protein